MFLVDIQIFNEWKLEHPGLGREPAANSRGFISLNVLLFDDYELLDVYGPMELLAGSNVLPIGESKGKMKISFISVSGQGVSQDINGVSTPEMGEDLDRIWVALF